MTPAPEPTSAQLLAWLGPKIGRKEPTSGLELQLIRRGESGGAVWRVWVQAHSFALKRFGPGRAWAQARAARDWSKGISPEWLAYDDAMRLALTVWVEERPRGTEEVFSAAAALLSELHGRPCRDEDPLSLEQAWHVRCQALRSRIIQQAGDTSDLAGCGPLPDELHLAWGGRVPTHRDFRRENWLDDGGRLWLIDFEHAGLDAAEIDLARAWLEAPSESSWRAFKSAYGGPIDPARVAAVARYLLLGDLLHPLTRVPRYETSRELLTKLEDAAKRL